MEQIHMEKKNSSRSASVAKQGQEAVKPRGDYVSKKKNVQQAKRKEYEKLENSKRTQTNRCWAGQRNVRTREKVDSQVNARYELNSVQRLGGKKQNISHLISFDYGHGGMRSEYGRGGTRSNQATYSLHKNHRCKTSDYNKEHFLQANCQFVVPWGLDYSAYNKNPDQLIEWDLVEEIKFHSTVWPNCPICLYPPVAAKMTKCGHIFCFPCILHYLALSDDKWRKCPICFDPIQKNYLKSVVFVNSKDYQIGDEIQFTLMLRDKESVIAMPSGSTDSTGNYFTNVMPSYFSSPDVINKFKLITATYEDISEMIIAREKQELLEQHIRDSDQPEVCFTEQAMDLVDKRFAELKMQTSLRQLQINDGSSAPTLESSAYLPPGAVARSDSMPIGAQASNYDPVSTDDGVKMCMSVSPPNYLRKGMNQNQKERIDHRLSYFYQASDGEHFYLHSLNVQMLKYEYGQIEHSPLNVSGKIVYKETFFMTKELRQRYRYLQHLPLSCQFSIVEIDIAQPSLSPDTLECFKQQIANRVKMRERKKNAEIAIERRVQKEEDKMYGRTTQSWHNVHFESLDQFPDFTHEPSLVVEEKAEEVGRSVPDSSVPSFAQKLQTSRKSVEEFPVLCASPSVNSGSFWAVGVSPRTNSTSSGDSGVSPKTNDASSPDDEEWEKPPEHRVNFALLIDNAMSKDSTGNKKSSKKNKKKKGTVIKLTGGGM